MKSRFAIWKDHGLRFNILSLTHTILEYGQKRLPKNMLQHQQKILRGSGATGASVRHIAHVIDSIHRTVCNTRGSWWLHAGFMNATTEIFVYMPDSWMQRPRLSLPCWVHEPSRTLQESRIPLSFSWIAFHRVDSESCILSPVSYHRIWFFRLCHDDFHGVLEKSWKSNY